MRKAFKNKFTGTKKLVRKVFTRSSSPSRESLSEMLEERMEQELVLKNELEALKDQISNLKAAIQALQSESEQKDVSIANLARDKEKITLDLLRTKRSNTSLAKQLDEERKYYFQEKEMYCREMNECKKIKKILSNSSVCQTERTIEEYRNEISKLKQTLQQTLEANYNLSIKFLRMKNTKTCLKTELQTMKLEHEKLANEYKSKIERLTIELNDLVNEKINDALSPSNKKYLQLVKQNSCLVYENLCLQLEVDNLNFKLEKLQLHKTKSVTNEQLNYIHHKVRPDFRKPKEILKNQVENETPEKLEKEPKPCCSKSIAEEYETVKIYERKKSIVVPSIQIIDETKDKERRPKKKKTQEETEILKTKEKRSEPKSVKLQKSQPNSVKTNTEIKSDYKIDVDENYKQKIANYDPSKLALFQISNDTSSTSTNCYITTIKRTQSSPDIVQTSNFGSLL